MSTGPVTLPTPVIAVVYGVHADAQPLTVILLYEEYDFLRK